jgi:hypothetical protein
LIFDSAISNILVRYYENKHAPVPIDYLVDKTKILVQILDHEFFTRENPKPLNEAIKNRLDLYCRLGEVKLIDGAIHLMHTKSNKEPFLFSYLNFFAEMSSYLFDTYLCVILAISEMCKQSK